MAPRYRNDHDRRPMGLLSALLGILLTLLAIFVVAGVGYAEWPRIKEAYYAQPTQPPVPTTPAAPANPPARQQAPVLRQPVIVQSVPQEQAPQPVIIPVQPPVQPPVDT